MININEVIGIPYADMNCWQLFTYLQRNAGRDIPDISVPICVSGKEHAIRTHEERNNWTETSVPCDMDAVLMRHWQRTSPSHIGVWWHGKVLHTTYNLGCHLADLNSLTQVQGLHITGYYKYKDR